ncbi:hypothetical protein [Microcystis phage Mwe-JY26]
MTEDEKIATQIKATTAQLNNLVERAADLGITVEFDFSIRRTLRIPEIPVLMPRILKIL